jgi:hypothetical protein
MASKQKHDNSDDKPCSKKQYLQKFKDSYKEIWPFLDKYSKGES